MSKSGSGKERCSRDECDGEGRWRWWNGMGAFGPYCDDHARDQLDDQNRCPITRREDKARQYRRTNRAVVIPAGLQPAGDTYPTIRTKYAFDRYLETDGREPTQCEISWCSKLEGECSHADEEEARYRNPPDYYGVEGGPGMEGDNA